MDLNGVVAVLLFSLLALSLLFYCILKEREKMRTHNDYVAMTRSRPQWEPQTMSRKLVVMWWAPMGNSFTSTAPSSPYIYTPHRTKLVDAVNRRWLPTGTSVRVFVYCNPWILFVPFFSVHLWVCRHLCIAADRHYAAGISTIHNKRIGCVIAVRVCVCVCGAMCWYDHFVLLLVKRA